MITADDLHRIEEKLDKIQADLIEFRKFFNIAQAPRRSKAELYQEADAKILRLQDRKKNRNKGI